ncbi:MAG TPA: lytic transglycosylase domain-containing protein [Nitrospiria bacterium]|nr:lytic transglycosylase domain-containing protein [Nitrospiria bacterium]
MRRNRVMRMAGVYLVAGVVGGVGGMGVMSPPASGATELYHFMDEQGVLHFSNVPTDPRFRPLRSADAVQLRSRSLPTSPLSSRLLDRLVRQAARQYGVEVGLIKAVIKAESDFDTYAVSRAGAQGLMQLMPATAELLEVEDPFDPSANIFAGVRHLRELLDRFDGNIPLAVAAYNAGALRVEAAGGIPAIDETRQYVQRVLTYYRDYVRRDPPARAWPVRRVITADGGILLTNAPARSYPGSP